MQDSERTSAQWTLRLAANSVEEAERLPGVLSGAIVACGGWVFSRRRPRPEVLDLRFEFERRDCVEMYSMLVATGLELSRNSHYRFTELCLCTSLQWGGLLAGTKGAGAAPGFDPVQVELRIYVDPMRAEAPAEKEAGNRPQERG